MHRVQVRWVPLRLKLSFDCFEHHGRIGRGGRWIVGFASSTQACPCNCLVTLSGSHRNCRPHDDTNERDDCKEDFDKHQDCDGLPRCVPNASLLIIKPFSRMRGKPATMAVVIRWPAVASSSDSTNFSAIRLITDAVASLIRLKFDPFCVSERMARSSGSSVGLRGRVHEVRSWNWWRQVSSDAPDCRWPSARHGRFRQPDKPIRNRKVLVDQAKLHHSVARFAESETNSLNQAVSQPPTTSKSRGRSIPADSTMELP